jgi:hypothetical protein
VPNLRVSVAVGDFNLDGRLDVVVGTGDLGNLASSVELVLGNGDGTLDWTGTGGSYFIGGYPGPIAVGDFNKDGRPDIAAGNWGTSTVSLLRNIQGPDFSVQAAGVSPIMGGQSGSSTITLSSILGYSQSVTLSCMVFLTSESATAALPTCSFSPATVQLAANGTATSAMTISTSASAAAINNVRFGHDGRKRYALLLSFSGMAFAMVWMTPNRKSKLAVLFAGALLTALLALCACGGSGGSGTSRGGGSNPPATYSIYVAATSGSLVRVSTLTVTVQ